MKKRLLLIFIILAVTMSSCFELEKNKRKNILGSIGERDTLTLYHNTDNCGKWGGDMYEIKVYQNSNKILVCDLIIKEMQCSDSLKNISGTTREIELTKQHKLKIEECINELTRNHLDNELSQELSGAYSYVRNTDESLIIKDSGSKWKSFFKLVKSLQEIAVKK